MKDLNYRLDRSAFQAFTHKEADADISNSKCLSWSERVNHFNYLMSVAYRFLGEEWPQMDKGHFEKIKRQ